MIKMKHNSDFCPQIYGRSAQNLVFEILYDQAKIFLKSFWMSKSHVRTATFFLNVYTDIKIRPPYSTGHKTFENSFYALNTKAKNIIFDVYTVMKIRAPPVVVGIKLLKIVFTP